MVRNHVGKPWDVDDVAGALGDERQLPLLPRAGFTRVRFWTAGGWCAGGTIAVGNWGSEAQLAWG